MNPDIDKLNELEVETIKDLERYLTGMLVYHGNVEKVISSIQNDSTDLVKQITRAKKKSSNIVVNDNKLAKETKTTLKIATIGLLLLLARRIQVSKEKEFANKVVSAVKDSNPKTEEIISTEIYKSYNLKIVQQNPGKSFRWNSENDKRTCSACSSKSGKIYKDGEVEFPPLHPRCRCILEKV